MKILMYLLWLVAWLKSRRFRRANGLNDRSRKLPRSKRTMGLQVGLGKIRRFWKQRPRILQFHLVQCSLLLRCNLREDHSTGAEQGKAFPSDPEHAIRGNHTVATGAAN